MERKKEENEYLEEMCALEELAQKKANIYARLLFDPALSKKMEALSLRHGERKATLERILYGEVKSKSKSNEGGMSAMKGEEGK